MKLVLAIINDDDAINVMELLREGGFQVTKLATTGGFLRSGNTTLICGVEDDKVPTVIDIIETNSRSRKQITSTQAGSSMSIESYIPTPIEILVGGGTIFVLDVEQFKKV
ncbi:MAG: cyclic-di-AMP receptor [Lachnospirales bacterium]